MLHIVTTYLKKPLFVGIVIGWGESFLASHRSFNAVGLMLVETAVSRAVHGTDGRFTKLSFQ